MYTIDKLANGDYFVKNEKGQVIATGTIEYVTEFIVDLENRYSN